MVFAFGGLLSYLRYLRLIVYSGVQHILTIWETWRCVIRGSNCLPFAGSWVQPWFLVRFVLLIVLVFYVVVFFRLFVCLPPVSCVTNVASFSGLSILDCPFGFLYRLFKFNTLLQITDTVMSYKNNIKYISYVFVDILYTNHEEPSLSWSYGSWIYNYLCNQWIATEVVSSNSAHARYTRYNIMW